MSISISAQIDSRELNQLFDKLSKFEMAAEDPRTGAINNELLKAIREYARKRWVTNFNLGGTLYGGWPKLSPNTDKGQRPLYQTGEMYNFLQFQAGNAVIGNGQVLWSFGGAFGAGERMIFHQFGTERSIKSSTAAAGNFQTLIGQTWHVPPRKLVGFNAEDRRMIRRMVLAQARKFVSMYI